MSIYGPLELITAPTLTAVTVANLRDYLRSVQTEEDALLTRLIAVATDYVERDTGRQLLTATYDQKLSAFWNCQPFKVPKAPLQSITSVKYYDTNGTQQTLSSSYYLVHGSQAQQGTIELAPDYTWPSVDSRLWPVTVRFVCGWTAAASIPAAIVHAIYMLVGHWNENREALLVGSVSKEIEMGVEALLNKWALGQYA